MLVVYRITDIPSTNPSPIFQEDKKALNELCLKSFIEAFKDVQLSMIFLCDFCSYDTVRMINKLVPGGEILSTEVGINETMVKSYEIAKESQEDTILFQECDYYYLPNTGLTFLTAVQTLGLVSPYDHPDFYTSPDIHPKECEIALVDNHHFRTAKRNTMTFAMTKKVLLNNYYRLLHWGYLDNEVWTELKEKGSPLWTPIDSIATHMVKDYLAPSINWKSLWKIQTS